jgi:hypothetical protein
LVAGPDRSHNNGPGWIWSGLSFDRRKDVVEVRWHTLLTAVDHPIPFANRKLYMKLLSPVRVLDWGMYTDSLCHNGGTTTVPSTLGTNSKEQPSSVQRKPVLAPFLAQRRQRISLVKE